MPIATIGLGLGTALAGGAAAGATVYGSRKAGQASQRAAEIQSQADAEALTFEREREAEARRQWDAEQAFNAQQFAAQEEERVYNRRQAEARDARQQPYRQASAAALGRLGQMLGIQVPAGTPTGEGTRTVEPGAAPMSMPQNSGYGGGIRRGGWHDGSGINPGVMYSRGPLQQMPEPPVNLPRTLGDQLNLRSRRRIDPRSY